MISVLATQITSCLEKRGYLINDDFDVVSYGLFSFFSKLFYLIISVVFGFLFQRIIESILFYFSFLFIKKYAGGYHAATERKCLILSSFSVILSVLIINLCVSLSLMAKTIMMTSVVSGVIIVFFAPVSSEEKPLSAEEIKTYRKYSVIRLIIMFLIIFLLYLCSMQTLCISINMGIVLESILLIAGKLKRHYSVNE